MLYSPLSFLVPFFLSLVIPATVFAITTLPYPISSTLYLSSTSPLYPMPTTTLYSQSPLSFPHIIPSYLLYTTYPSYPVILFFLFSIIFPLYFILSSLYSSLYFLLISCHLLFFIHYSSALSHAIPSSLSIIIPPPYCMSPPLYHISPSPLFLIFVLCHHPLFIFLAHVI